MSDTESTGPDASAEDQINHQHETEPTLAGWASGTATPPPLPDAPQWTPPESEAPQWTPPSPPQPPTAPAPWWAVPTTPRAEVPPAAPVAKRERSALVGAVVGALVGSLVTGGLFLAFRDDVDNSNSTSRTGVTFADTSTPVEPLPPAKDGGINVQAVLQRMQPSVVTISVQTLQGSGGGTGVIVGSNGTIVTNAHVVDDAQSIKVTLSDGDEVDAKITGVDASHDLAVISIDRTGLTAAVLGDSDRMEVGQPVVAIGNALGLGVSITSGIVSAIDREINEPNGQLILGALQTDAAINPGNSGGPLVNAAGQVIGINTAIASPQESNNVGFAISISSAKPIIEALSQGREPRDAFLGVATQDVTPSLVREKDLRVDAGAYVLEVPSDSPAADADIKVGDVITELDGVKVTGRDQLRRLIRRNPAGETVKLRVVASNGKERALTITLGEAPTREQ